MDMSDHFQAPPALPWRVLNSRRVGPEINRSGASNLKPLPETEHWSSVTCIHSFYWQSYTKQYKCASRSRVVGKWKLILKCRTWMEWP